MEHCGEAKLVPRPDARTLAVVCDKGQAAPRPGTGGAVAVLDTQTGEHVQQLNVPGVKGAASSPDGRQLYLVTRTLDPIVVDPAQGTIIRVVDLGDAGSRVLATGLIALSESGTQLIIGLRPEDGHAADQLWMFETASWQEVGRRDLEHPLVGRTLLIESDGQTT